MRILAISDLHTDFHENWLVLKQLSDESYQLDTLIVAGDIASHPEIITRTLTLLQAKFRHVFYIPGNHELWVGNGHFDSIDKFFHIVNVCDILGIYTRPAQIGKVWIVPLLSWYSSDFANDGHEYAHRLQGWTDFHACRWPKNLGDVAEYFSRLNEPHIQTYDRTVISFSHFVPRPDLLPSRKYLFFKALPQVAGSLLIEKQIRRLQSNIHVFGHSHIKRDVVLEGVRYVQNPFSYPRERTVMTFPEKIIWHD